MPDFYAAATDGNDIVTATIKVKSHDQDENQNYIDIPSGYKPCPAGTGIGFTDNLDGTFSASAPAPFVPTQADYVNHVQKHLDARAQTMNYDNIFTGISYADEPAVPDFQAEGQALRSWRSLVWAECYTILDDVNAQTRPAPTLDELITELDTNVPYVPPA